MGRRLSDLRHGSMVPPPNSGTDTRGTSQDGLHASPVPTARLRVPERPAHRAQPERDVLQHAAEPQCHRLAPLPPEGNHTEGPFLCPPHSRGAAPS